MVRVILAILLILNFTTGAFASEVVKRWRLNESSVGYGRVVFCDDEHWQITCGALFGLKKIQVAWLQTMPTELSLIRAELVDSSAKSYVIRE